jgi:hypothetical protein
MDAPLTDSQKASFCTVVQLGCSRATACKYIGVPPAQIHALLQSDPAFAQQVAQAEAKAEVQFMHQVNKAAQDEKNWRTSVWWLEQHAREESSAASSTVSDLVAAVCTALEKFAEIVVTELPDTSRRQAIIAQLLLIADEATRGGPSLLKAVSQSPVLPVLIPSEEGERGR